MSEEPKDYSGKVSPLQLVCRTYGTQIRYIRSLKATTKTANSYSPTFTQDDIDLIETICEDAEKRAKVVYDEARQSEEAARPPVSSRPKTKRGIGSW